MDGTGGSSGFEVVPTVFAFALCPARTICILKLNSAACGKDNQMVLSTLIT